MIIPILLIIMLLLFAVALYLNKNFNGDFELLRDVSGVLSLILVFVLVIWIGCANSKINNYLQTIRVIDDKVAIYTKKKDILETQYRSLLDTSYRNHENGLYDKMTSKMNNTNTTIVIYPSMPPTKYSETVIKLVDEIKALNDDIYKLQLNKIDYLVNCRIIKSGVWIPKWVIMDIDK